MLARVVRDESLANLLDAYRGGDPQAQDRLLKAVEPMLLRYVQRDMGAQARSMEQSVDLSQSLLLAFHIALSQGKAEMRDEAGLRAYLRTMVRNKLANRADRNKAAKRGSGERPLSIDSDQDEEVKLQIPAENLTTQGYGEQFLKIQTPAPERQNRRVTVRRITPLLAGR